MPILKISTVLNTSPEMRQRLIQRLTDVVTEEMNVPPQTVNILIEHVDATCWGVAGQDLTEFVNKRR